MGGLLRTAPVLAVLFAIPALTLAGMPPTAGFVAKLALLQAGAGAGPVTAAVAGVVILASLLTLYALTRVWVRVFWGEPTQPLADDDPDDEVVVGTARTPVTMYLATAGLVAVSLAIAVAAGPLSALTARAGTRPARPGAVPGGRAGGRAMSMRALAGEGMGAGPRRGVADPGVGAALGLLHAADDRGRGARRRPPWSRCSGCRTCPTGCPCVRCGWPGSSDTSATTWSCPRSR